MLRPLLFATLAVSLAGCDRSGDTSSVTINAEGGTFSGGIDGRSGEMKIDVPGFKGSVALPKVRIDTGDFDLNGVKLYPGSRIENIDVSGEDGTNDIRVRFTSPATPEAVRTWFGERLGKVGYRIHGDGTALVGTTDENRPFRLEVTPDGTDKAKGAIRIGG